MTYPAWVQPKLNGLRASYDPSIKSFVSGDGVIWPAARIPHLLKAFGKLSCNVRKTDGEFYCHGWSLQRINKTVGVGGLSTHPDHAEVKFHVFDSVGPKPFLYQFRSAFKGRYMDAQNIVDTADNHNICVVLSYLVSNQSELDKLYMRLVDEGYEGVVIRCSKASKTKRKNGDEIPDSVDQGYLEGKRPYWMLKRKDKFDAEFKVVAVEEGKITAKGSRNRGRLGAMVCVTKKGKRFNVGGGFSDLQRIRHWKNPPIGKMLRVEYGRLSDEGIPCEPRAFDGEIRDYA